MSTKPWAISGGGIAGLASALALANTGRKAIVFEKTNSFAPLGAGLQLGPNAVRSLQKLGCWEIVSPYCTSPDEIVIRDGVTGRQLQIISLAENFVQKFGAPYRVILRADLHAALQIACAANRRIEIKMGKEWQGELDNVEALLAADGIWSPLRLKHFQNAQAVILPHSISRAIVPLPANVNKNAVTLWLYPDGHVVHYAVGNPLMLNIVCVTKSSSSAGTWDQNIDPIKLTQFFDNACAELKVTLASVADWLSWPAAFVPVIPKWSNHNMLLIGDAAHATAPYLAQGAAMALEDASLLSQLSKNHTSIQSLFSQFETVRKPRVLRHHQAVLSNVKTYHAAGILRHARNLALRTMPQDIFLQRMAWLYKY